MKKGRGHISELDVTKTTHIPLAMSRHQMTIAQEYPSSCRPKYPSSALASHYDSSNCILDPLLHSTARRLADFARPWSSKTGDVREALISEARNLLEYTVFYTVFRPCLGGPVRHPDRIR